MSALDPSLKWLSDRQVEQALTGDPDDKKSKPVEKAKPAGKDGPK
jgi:hypothetical protein